jgi:hypothetical protein
LAREGELPARKVGREWRFARAALLDHLAGGGVVSTFELFPSRPFTEFPIGLRLMF